MIDLRTCKPGDKLLSVHGAIFEYIEHITNYSAPFPHRVKLLRNYDASDKTYVGSYGTRTDDGQVFTKNKLPDDHDIVEILS